MSFRDFLNESKIKLGSAKKTTVDIDGDSLAAIEYELPDGYMCEEDGDKPLKAAAKLFGEKAVELGICEFGGEESFEKLIQFKRAKIKNGMKMTVRGTHPVLSVLVTPTSYSKLEIEKFINEAVEPIQIEVAPKIKGKADQGMGFWSDFRKGKM